MKVQLLIATGDCAYAEHLSKILAENHEDTVDVCVCSTTEHLKEQLALRKFDVALLEASLIGETSLQTIHLPLLLWSEEDNTLSIPLELKKVRKYQRISSMVSNILELYSKGLPDARGSFLKKARITAVWSPVGGVGKTTAALAYCARKVSDGKQALYLDLEPFSSVSTYFAETGRSISAVFEMLEAGEGNIQMLIMSIRKQSGGCGITYFCRPENFDDINILTPDNIAALIDACSEVTDELVIDMSCVCDDRTRKVFEIADRVFLVADASRAAQIKFSQFVSQHNVFQRIRDKTTLIANKGAAINDSLADTIIHLPLIQSTDEAAVYKTLSSYSFEI